jgi:hypothetical protein
MPLEIWRVKMAEAEDTISPEITLWRSVLRLTFDDVTGGLKTTNPIDVHRAKQWVGSRDFGMVCHLAGLDPLATLERFKEAI